LKQTPQPDLGPSQIEKNADRLSGYLTHFFDLGYGRFKIARLSMRRIDSKDVNTVLHQLR
jgi:hypothetical protein